jgi:two-component system LytT family sensor kinase
MPPSLPASLSTFTPTPSAALAPDRRRFVVACAGAWCLFWTLMVLVSVQEFVRNGQAGLWQPVLWEASSALVSTLLMLAQARATRGLDRYLGQPLRWFACQALWLPLFALLFVPLVFGIRHAVYALAGLPYEHLPWGALLLYESTKVAVFLGLFVAIRFGLKSYWLLQDARVRAEQANALLRLAQLQRLTQQMQPHFLFNALNTISALMHTDVEAADTTLLQLADVLRATLALGERHETALSAELALARGYAGVMGARFAGRVALDWDVDDALLDVPVPAMSLQPLLENVFKHTVERRRGLTRISVRAWRDGDALVLRVDDDAGTLAARAIPDTGAGHGIGLSNLRARLDALYGGRAGLALSERLPAGVRAELRLPCGS